MIYIPEVVEMTKHFPYDYNTMLKLWSMGLTEEEISKGCQMYGDEYICHPDGSCEKGILLFGRMYAYSKSQISKMQAEFISKGISSISEKEKERQKRFNNFHCWNPIRRPLNG